MNVIRPNVKIRAQHFACNYNCLLLNLLEPFGLCLNCYALTQLFCNQFALLDFKSVDFNIWLPFATVTF